MYKADITLVPSSADPKKTQVNQKTAATEQTSYFKAHAVATDALGTTLQYGTATTLFLG